MNNARTQNVYLQKKNIDKKNKTKNYVRAFKGDISFVTLRLLQPQFITSTFNSRMRLKRPIQITLMIKPIRGLEIKNSLGPIFSFENKCDI